MLYMTLDFESFYSKTYSLSKLTTEEYINEYEFEVIGVSIKLGDTPTAWYTGDHEYMQGVLSGFNWDDITVIAHNCFFDASILSLHYNIFPARYIDTLSMARAIHGVSVGGSLAKLAAHYELGEKGTEVVNALGKHLKDFSQEELDKYGEYCINDTELTYALLQKLTPQFSATELALVDITIKMGVVPKLEVCLALLESHLYAVKAAKQALLDKVAVDKAEIMSNPKFAKLLEGCGVEVPMKLSLATGKMTYAFAKTDDGLKDLLEHPNMMVQTLVGVRLGVKSTLEETRTERFIGIAKRMGKIPVPLSYYGAATGRWSACLVADTMLQVYSIFEGVVNKRIVDVLLDDLVWDGEDFVAHEGVVFNGYAEVMSYDGITGTDDHIVFTEDGERTLLEAMQRQSRISTAKCITEEKVESARAFAGINKN
jgi:DNA polymerase